MAYTQKHADRCRNANLPEALAELLDRGEHGEFAAYIAANPDEGDPVKRSGGVRKVRWSRAGSGKSSGVRVVYFNRKKAGEVVLLLIYAKAKLDSVSGETLKELRDAAEKASE